eukprot:GHVT01037326.1.p1 GENE.GHVT01037326.1~~GHVT01037326.1.p1  ORF type:complete len:380 (+),score=60.83 GHVT01037326.1:716-1855(+)
MSIQASRGGSRRAGGTNNNAGSGASSHAEPPAVANEKDLATFLSDWGGAVEQDDLSSADYYFNSYSHFGIHEEMLKDSVRTGAYQRAIENNAHLFKGKIVLDVGSGTGILCLFAARAGAAHVYGIECTQMVDIATKIANTNGYGDRITYIQGKAEDVTLPVEKVDILLSEWMGYFLLYESMLDTVLFCRDKWLKPEGLIFPDKASIHIAGIEDAEYKQEKIGYWSRVYGFDYSCVQKCVMEEPIVDTVEEAAITTTASCVLELDLKTCTAENLSFSSAFALQARRKDFVHAVIGWFEIVFSGCHTPVVFTSSPFGRYTHWKQTVFYLQDVIAAEKGEWITGKIAVRKSQKNPRDLDIKINYDFKGKFNQAARTQNYRLR